MAKPMIEPLANFDWRAAEPMKLRPFKPKYHITMALQASTPSELIIMDKNYHDRVAARRQIIADHASAVLGAIPAGHAAVAELYAYLLGAYLPTRFPTMFELGNPTTGGGGATTTRFFRNKVTGRDAPLQPPPPADDPLGALRILGETVEDDMFLLLRGEEEQQQHRAVAFVCCHPSGFAPAGKLGRRLAEIHGPVPGYHRIAASMERYFSRLEVGRSVKRVNWSVQTHPDLFAPPPSGNHVHLGDAVEEEQGRIEVDAARFRVELQTLTRLPETGAILFSFKTYMYPLEDIKAEGLGPQLAEAIEGLKEGNAPDMWVYKGAIRWGRAVCEYLKE
ncbi:hypothetical protein VTK56DRAFT_9751 [Thermocarpiscus australiensis]